MKTISLLALTLALAACRTATPTPRYQFDQCVRIVGGFYRGFSGKANRVLVGVGDISYLINIGSPTGLLIDEKDLEACK
jgi:hypothetical protein